MTSTTIKPINAIASDAGKNSMLPDMPPLANVCSPTEDIERWLTELTMHLFVPRSELQSRGLHWNDFPTTGISIKMPDGSLANFERAFHVPEEDNPLHIAVFTEDDGCHEMWLTPECSVNILV